MRDDHGAGSANGVETTKQPTVSALLSNSTVMSVLIFASYGVSKVHDQQWEYLLADTQTANNSMRALLKVVRTDGIDPEAGKARYVQFSSQERPSNLRQT